MQLHYPFGTRGNSMRFFQLAILLAAVSVQAQQFQSPVYYQVGATKSLAQGSASADFNNDGIPDIAVATTGGQLSVLLGKGDGTFQPPKVLKVALGAFGVAAGDLNGDGKVDLVVSVDAPISSLSVYLGQGDGTFTPKAKYSAPPYLHTPVLADFNGDGHLDVAANDLPGNHQGSVVVWFGSGDGTLQSPTKYHIPGGIPLGVAVGDLNGDGHPDLTVADGATSNADVLLNNGDGTFQPVVQYPIGGGLAQCVTIADLNADGKPDLALGTTFYQVDVLLNNGDGTFGSPAEFSTAGDLPFQIIATDLNLDGKVDLAVAANEDQLLYGNGDGTFGNPVALPIGGISGNSMVSADFNRDGAPDLAQSTANKGVPAEAVLINTQ
jgi:hypothetical protein